MKHFIGRRLGVVNVKNSEHRNSECGMQKSEKGKIHGAK